MRPPGHDHQLPVRCPSVLLHFRFDSGYCPMVRVFLFASRYYGCSGRPLCKTKRPGPKNGPLIEMEAVAEEDPPDADTRANRGVASVSSIYGQQTPRERGGASR